MVDFMGLNCQYGIAQSKRNIWLADHQQECSMFHTWASSPSEVTMLDNGSRVYQLRELLPFLQAVAATHFLDHEGQIIDDMIFAIKSDDCVLGVPNASMVPTMWNWFCELLPDDGSVTVENLSDETSIIALQGPNSEKFSPLLWVEKIALGASSVKK